MCIALAYQGRDWIRAPFESGKPARSRIVELRIDDLAGLLEDHGMELEFWMIVDEVGGQPRWVSPVDIADTLAQYS